MDGNYLEVIRDADLNGHGRVHPQLTLVHVYAWNTNCRFIFHEEVLKISEDISHIFWRLCPMFRARKAYHCVIIDKDEVFVSLRLLVSEQIPWASACLRSRLRTGMVYDEIISMRACMYAQRTKYLTPHFAPQNAQNHFAACLGMNVCTEEVQMADKCIE